MSKKTAAHVALFLCALLCAACSGDEEEGYVFPSLVTEFVELHTDDTGLGTQFTTDGGSGFAVNAPLQGLQPNALYRLVLGYETTDETRGRLPVARVYTVDYVALLQPTEEPAAEDEPAGIDAVWRGADYLNLQLSPKTQGGTQLWGYRTDSITSTPDGRRTFHLSLYHRQPDDPYSYSTTAYASLPLFQVEELQPGDSLTFTGLTFDGQKTWHFSY